MPNCDKKLAPWLNTIFHSLNDAQTMEEALHVVIEGTKSLLPYQSIALLLINEDTEELYIKTSRNISYGFVKSFNHCITGQLITKVLMQHDKLLKNKMSATNDNYQELKLEHDYSALVIAPIIQEHRAIGYLHCDRADGEEFTEDAADALQVIAGLLGLLMEKHQWMFLSRHLCRVDEISKALKYNAFMDEFRRELTRSRTDGRSMNLLMVDVDGYTAFVREHGCAAGHALLEKLHKLIRRCVREHDLIGRFGADEFIVCMGNATREEGETSLEAIRRSAEQHAGEEWHTTVTVSGVGLTLASTEDFNTLLEKILTTLSSGLIQGRSLGTNRTVYVTL